MDVNTMTIDVSLIAISLNSRGFLRECIQSIHAARWRGVTFEIIVVDNASTDGTLAMLAADFPDVRVVANDANVGYCRAGNQGAATSRGRHLLFLNDDTLIIDDAVASIVEWADAHDAAMIGSRLLNTDGTDQFSSGRTFTTPAATIFGRKSVLTRLFPNAPWARRYLRSDLSNTNEPYEVDWLSAAAMMVRRDVFEQVGGLAEDFYYFHEQVFCARVKRAGGRVYLHPQSRIIHHEGAGSGVRTRRVRRRHIVAFHAAALRWFCLHHGLGPVHPVRFIAAAGLWVRAGLLVTADAFRNEQVSTTAQLETGRPEGGVAL
jgi:N-acetylglucosaminyl-diphospho-decaprenol L-rhamnosyltransferase